MSWDKNVLQYLRQAPKLEPGGPDFAKLADDLKAEVNGDRITVAMDAGKASNVGLGGARADPGRTRPGGNASTT